MNKEIAKLTNKVIELLNLEDKEEKPIYVGDKNIEHMKKEHLEDYIKYRF